MAGKTTNVLKQLGKDILKTAFPDVYKKSLPYARALSSPKPGDDVDATNPLTKSINKLNRTTIESNDLAVSTLEAILAQNELLNRIAKSGIKVNGDNDSGILDTIKKGLGGAAAGGTVKKVMNALRNRPKTPIQNKLSKMGTAGKIGSKLIRATPILSGAMQGAQEYGETGDMAKAATVGVGAAGGAWGGAALGAALGTVFIPIPVVGTAIGGLAGGALGSWMGSSVARAGYDYVTGDPATAKGEPFGLLSYKAMDITLKAQDIIISGLQMKMPGLAAPGSAAARIPTFRRGIGGADQDMRRAAAADAAVRGAEQQRKGSNGGGKADTKGEVLPNKEGSFEPGFGGRIGQGLGAQRPGHLHQGQDIMMKHGSDITASMDGVVIKSEAQGGALNQRYGGTSGGIVTIRYANGVTAKYMHTSDPYDPSGPIVKKGQKVKAGDVIGKSGTAAGVPHVHYELYDKDGKRMDPAAYHGWKEGGRIESPAERKAREEQKLPPPKQEAPDPAQAKADYEAKMKNNPFGVGPKEPKPEPKPEPEAKKEPVASTGKLTLDPLVKSVRAKYGTLSNFYSDDQIKAEAIKKLQQDNPNLKIGKDGSVSGAKTDIDNALKGTAAGLKEKGLNVGMDKLYKPTSLYKVEDSNEPYANEFADNKEEDKWGKLIGAKEWTNNWRKYRKFDDRRDGEVEETHPDEKGWLDRYLDKRNAYKPDEITPEFNPNPLSAGLGAADLLSQDQLMPPMMKEYELQEWNKFTPAVSKEVPGPVTSQLERLRMERDKLKRTLLRERKEASKENDNDNNVESTEEESTSQKDNSRSDRAVWNINPQLHEEAHPQ